MATTWILLLSIICTALGNSTLPNIVLILTDDQDLVLGGLTPMIKTQRLIANQGATFTNAFVTTPICCPSRSSLLTGCYLHNHGTVNNSVSGGCSSTAWQQQQETQSFATHLHSLGYTTFYAGKYLNQYGKPSTGGTRHVPPGWDWWIGLVGNSRYYNYTLSVNGTAKYYSQDYLTNVITNYGLEFLHHMEKSQGSFLMVLAPPAPHAPFTPEPQYQGRYKHVKVMKTPNFNVTVHKDKHWLLRMMPSPLPDDILPTLDTIYHQRWETLLSVDDLVEATVKKIKLLNKLSNTYIFFTSDHGYHIGQFGLPWDKRQPYESDLRVPLLVRGPGIAKRKIIAQPVLNIDLASTFLDIAGLTPPVGMDGKSFLPNLKDLEAIQERMFLVEYRGEGDNGSVAPECTFKLDNSLSECTPEACCKCQDSRNNTYTCIRHLGPDHNFLYCKFFDSENFEEAYDMQVDPYQLHNIAPVLSANITVMYNEAMSKLTNCIGSQCLMV